MYTREQDCCLKNRDEVGEFTKFVESKFYSYFLAILKDDISRQWNKNHHRNMNATDTQFYGICSNNRRFTNELILAGEKRDSVTSPHG